MGVVRVRLAPAIVLFLLAGVVSAADLNGPVPFVPWHVLKPGDSPVKAQLFVFWVPASLDDFKHSELLFSRPLTLYASQCVGMHVIRADDAAMLERLGVAGALPVAVLAASDGKPLARVTSDRGALRVSAVEKMVREELRTRETAIDGRLDDARRRAAAGERDSAVAIYKSVWDERCVFPRKAREAQRELKKLGVQLADASF